MTSMGKRLRRLRELEQFTREVATAPLSGDLSRDPADPYYPEQDVIIREEDDTYDLFRDLVEKARDLVASGEGEES